MNKGWIPSSASHNPHFKNGDTVRVAEVSVLEAFRKQWGGIHPFPLTDRMIECAGQEGVVRRRHFYHGAEMLYEVTGMLGMIWPEDCLRPAASKKPDP